MLLDRVLKSCPKVLLCAPGQYAVAKWPPDMASSGYGKEQTDGAREIAAGRRTSQVSRKPLPATDEESWSASTKSPACRYPQSSCKGSETVGREDLSRRRQQQMASGFRARESIRKRKRPLPGGSGLIAGKLIVFLANLFPRAFLRERLLHPAPLSRLQIIGVTFHFLNNVLSLNLPLKPAQRVLQRLALLQSNFCQSHHPLSSNISDMLTLHFFRDRCP